MATRIAELAADLRMAEKADMWSRLNDLDTTVRPMLLTHLWPLAWSEVLPDESTLVCEHPDAQRYERELRQRIWTAETLNDDTVVEPVVCYPHCVTVEPYGGLAAAYLKLDRRLHGFQRVFGRLERIRIGESGQSCC